MPVSTEPLKTKKIILTSFRDAKNYDDAKSYKYSISRWQPRNSTYTELKSLAPFDRNGRAIKSLPPDIYREVYEREVLSSQNARKQLQAVVDLMNDGEQAILMCWCNPARQEEYSKLFCHRILVGWFIEKNFPYIAVVYADGAENPVWER